MATSPLPPHLSFGPERLLVVERFVSIQGEGASAGEPAVFVRLAHCNLACGWCDTPYSWDFQRFDIGREVQEHETAELAVWVAEQFPRRLILTGGEPLLQRRAIATLLRELDGRADFTVEVETNGTIRPDEHLLRRVDQWNVSLKLSSSGEPQERRIRPHAIEAFAAQKSSRFKFVVDDRRDRAEAQALVSCWNLEGRTWYMPQARSASALTERAPEISRWALSDGVSVSPRLHLQLFAGRRGQ